MSELLTRAQDAVRLAQSSGAQGAWASASRSRKVEFTARDGELEKVQEDTSRSVSLQLYVDGRYSSHSTTSLAPARLKSFVAEAVELTRALAAPEDCDGCEGCDGWCAFDACDGCDGCAL